MSIYMDKQIWNYYVDEELILRIGKVNYQKAQEPLSLHTHDNQVEIVLLKKGCQQYQVEDCLYTVKSNQAFVTYENEKHSTSNKPEDKAQFYFLIFNPNILLEENYICTYEDRNTWLRFFQQKTYRKVEIQIDHITYCEELVQLIQNYYEDETRAMLATEIRVTLSKFFIEFFKATKEGGLQKERNMELILTYIDEHIFEDIQLETLAKRYGVCVSRFKFLFRTEVGLPPREYILRKKIEKAQQFLKEEEYSVTYIATELAFSTPQYFSTVFKRYVYMSPAEFRRKHKVIE